MNDKKNIDRLFQEKFKDFEVAPSDAVWNRISDSLPEKKRKRRVVALWWQVGGIAAAIALLLTIGISVFNSDPKSSIDSDVVDTENTNDNSSSKDKQNELKDDAKYEKLEFVDSEKGSESINGLKGDDSLEKKSESENLISNPKSQLNSVTVYSDNKDNSSDSPNKEREKLTTTTDKENTEVASVNNKKLENSNKSELANDKELKSVIKKTIEDSDTAVSDNSKTKNSENSNSENTDATAATEDLDKEKKDILKEDPKKESILDAIAANNIEDKDIDEKEKEDEQNRWSIKPNVAPVYYSSLGKGSSIDGQFNENSKSSDINMSYGISTSYAVTKKLKVRTGVNVVNLNQMTSDVLAVSIPNQSPSASFTASGTGAVVQKYPNVTLNSHTQNVSIMSAKSMVSASSLDMSSYKVSNIDQRFGFIEVPLELEYRLLDNKFGVNVIGGFSTFFLNDNEIYADLDGETILIGEANNINNTSFSANFGLGLDYSLSKQWNINLEPQFKYQINTFNNTSGNYRPFFIGVYTGLSFKF
ncbi:hypothetical protein [Winogradskyella sp.]|uniref:hypothetical protein n=1 Tax=Winogradskyella sp. TaxID=1883156 RepID=UPI0035141B03